MLDTATVRVGELAVGKPAARRNIRSIESAEASESDVSDAINGLARLERNSRFELTESWNQDNNWGQNKVSTAHCPSCSTYLLKASLLQKMIKRREAHEKKLVPVVEVKRRRLGDRNAVLRRQNRDQTN